MAVRRSAAAQIRSAEQWFRGECLCSTCERHAKQVYPDRFLEVAAARAAKEDERQRIREKLEKRPWTPSWAVLGVDLGKRTDHSAVALLTPSKPGSEARYMVPSVTRLPLTSGQGEGHYLGQARRVARAVEALSGRVRGEVWVAVDATGVGDAVVEMVAAELERANRVRLVQIVITGGRSARHSGKRWSVSKTALLAPTQAAIEQGELAFGGFSGADTVKHELLSYRVKAASVEGGADRLEAAKQSDHDDTVLALAMAVYVARARPPTSQVMVPTGRVDRGYTKALYRRDSPGLGRGPSFW